jgi:hypothetical protein
MKRSMLLSLCLFAGAAAAQTQGDSSGYPGNTTVRKYAKRDRFLSGSVDYVSPAQLHESAGLRANLSTEVQNSELSKNDVKSKLSNPAVNAGVTYGWDALTLGLQAGYLNSKNEGQEGLSVVDKFTSLKVRPEAAYTFGSNFTAALGLEGSRLSVDQEGLTTNTFDYDFFRGVAGFSYHTPRLEVGLAYTTEVQDKSALSEGVRQDGLSLSSSDALTERAIYLPAMTTAYARGNLSDNWSVMSTVSMARYDGNVDGAVALFDQYNTADRLASKLVGTYWTTNRSRVSVAAEYKGAATTAVGSEEAALGYRLANLYGGSVEGVLSLNRQTYVGLNAGYMRGERNETLKATGEELSGTEGTAKVAGFVAVKL